MQMPEGFSVSTVEVDTPLLNRRQLSSLLDQLDLSADVKAILQDLAEITVTVGKRVLQIGRKIIEVALALFRAFANVIFGAIIASVLVMVISGVPALGALLANFVEPILLAVGIGQGALAEIQSGTLGERIDAFVQTLNEAIGVQ